MRLIEPLGLLDPAMAAPAIAAGAALPLAGGLGGFALARVIEPDGATSAPVPVDRLPGSWLELLPPVTAAPPSWAGLPDGPVVMGILNATPDSFSDGGRHLDPEVAIAAGRAMVADGAGMLDIGGESTRPAESDVVTPDQEQARVLPVVRGLAGCGAVLSVDTRNAATMAAVLAAGAQVINDISALEYDAAARGVAAAAGAPVVLMHMRGTPQSMNGLSVYADPAAEMVRELAASLAAAEAAGIARNNIAVDPGIGFAKLAPDSVAVLKRLPLLLNLGCRVVLGVSRKRFIMRLGGAESPPARMPGSLAAGLFGLARGASILRVHDVAETVQAVRVWQGLSC